MMVSFVLSFFPRDVLDEILNLIESVSEDFLTTLTQMKFVSTVDYTCILNFVLMKEFYLTQLRTKYSRTSVFRTQMARLPRLFRTRS